MKIIEVSEFLENLIEKTENKTEIKFYTRFIKILNQLEKTILTKEQILLVEAKLEELDFQSIQEKTYRNMKKKFLKFSTYLEEEFKIIQDGYYTSLGMSFGMMIGLATATIFGLEFGMGNETTGGLILGMSLGSIIGYFLDKKAEKENRVLKINTK